MDYLEASLSDVNPNIHSVNVKRPKQINKFMF